VQISKNEIKYLHSLSQKKARQAEKKFILEGWRALKEVLQSSFHVELVVVLPQYFNDPDYQKILTQIHERRISVKEITERELKKVADTVHSHGVIALVHQQPALLDDSLLRRTGLIVAADAVSDPGNIGSILRSADWFGADAVLLGSGCVELYNEKVIRSTVGSIFHIPIVENVDLPSVLSRLRKKEFFVAVASGDGKQTYTDVAYKRKNVLVLGNEAHGVAKEVKAVADVVMKIPKYGKAESLNVGVACGIILAQARQGRIFED
jgi:TrmH family RNA methyltransferase